MLKRFLPKEERYFDHFNDMIGHIAEMAAITKEMFSQEVFNTDLLLQLKPLERRCDDVLTTVVKQLNKSFITPFDREDIFSLIKRLDDISDTLLGACLRVQIFKIETAVEGADKLTTIVARQIAELDKAIHGMRTNSTSLVEAKNVKDLEAEADIVYQSHITKLFESEADAIRLMKKKEVLEILEHASDRCQDVANLITSIVIKNA
jgi:uncharacterized protein Yka (UPF0111/DUF47 family)